MKKSVAMFIMLLFGFFLLSSTSSVAFVSSCDWVEVTRFTEDDKFLQTPFTIEHVEWRIRWEYEPDPEVPEEHQLLYVYVWDQEFPGTYFETILKKGTNETSGTLYIHNRNGTFFLGVIRTVIGFTLIIEQNIDSIPEFPSSTPLLVMIVAVVALTVVYRHKMHKQIQRRGKQ